VRRRRILLAGLLAAAPLAGCSLLRSLDGYSDRYGLDAAGAGESAVDACTTCGIEILAQNQPRPHGIVVNATHFFWTNEGDGTVMRCEIAGCVGRPLAFAQGQATPTEIVLDDFVVYWANSGAASVGFCAVTGCPTQAFLVASPDGGATVAVALSLYPYWTATGGTVFACPSCGQPFTPTASPIATDQIDPGGIVVAKTATRTMPIWGTRGAVMRCTDRLCRDDAGVAPLATNQGPVERVALDAKNVYWANDTSIRSCPVDGCTGAPATIADGQDHPRGLAVDDQRVYWTNGDDTVRACPTGGCAGAPLTLAVSQLDPQGIAVTTAHVYWVSRGLGTVARRAKPPP
jgi:hypothetical protein